MNASYGEGVERGLSYGLDALIVTTPHATAAISVFGGQIISFKPSRARHDVLWISPTLASVPTPLRGGIPVCWPYFAREGQPSDAPSHGYARTAQWQLVASNVTDSGDVEVTLEPEGLTHLPLRVTQTIRVGATLHQSIRTYNAGSEPWPLTEAFHNYFRVSDVMDVRVDGLAGLTYLDKLDDMNPRTQQGDWILPPEDPQCDRLYPGTLGRHRIIDAGLNRVIELTGHASHSTIVWNPGDAAASTMADVGSAWREFVCVETATAGPDVLTLPPGATSEIGQSIAMTSLAH